MKFPTSSKSEIKLTPFGSRALRKVVKTTQETLEEWIPKLKKGKAENPFFKVQIIAKELNNTFAQTWVENGVAYVEFDCDFLDTAPIAEIIHTAIHEACHLIDDYLNKLRYNKRGGLMMHDKVWRDITEIVSGHRMTSTSDCCQGFVIGRIAIERMEKRKKQRKSSIG